MITVFLLKHPTHRTTSNLKLKSPCSTICIFLVMLILLFSTLVCTNSWLHLQTFQQNDTGVSGPVNFVRVQIHLPHRTNRISGLTAGKAPTARGCKETKRIYVCYLLVGLRWIFKTVSLRIKGPRGISSSKRTFLLFPWIKWCSFKQAFDMMGKNFSRLLQSNKINRSW